MEEQLRIPMPVVGLQLTVRRQGNRWVVDRRVLRQEQGWQVAGRWEVSDRRTAEICAAEALDQAWYVEPLD